MASPRALAQKLLAILDKDRDETLLRIDAYLHGHHDDPYMPDNADAEYKLLAKRCVSNWMPLLVGTPAQAMYVDTFRRGDSAASTSEMAHWERSRLGARQTAVHRGALTYGHSFTVTERMKKGVITRGLSALRTSALFEDPANDETPYAALTVVTFAEAETLGTGWLWDATYKYPVRFKMLSDKDSVTVGAGVRHGATECPVTRFAATVDLEGRTLGVIEPMMKVQDRINQTVFDLLVAQTYSSTQVRTVSGMAPPLQRDEEGEVVLDENGNPIPLPINHNAKRFLFAEDSDVTWGSLPGSPLNGFIESIDMSIRHFAAISQTPPHHLLGQIANLSAEALQAAETALLRKVEEFQATFGESWERVFRIAAELEGDLETAADFTGEVIWRDLGQKSLAQAADALGKMREQLGIPARGLWKRVPNVTQNELDEWEQLSDQADSELVLADALSRATPPDTTATALTAA